MTTKPEIPDLNAMAVEACDIWQAQLSALAQDPRARADLARFLEPQRRLFADWTALMQKGAASAASPNQPPQATPQTAGGDTSAPVKDDSLKTAQLALRIADMEKRLAALEAQLTASPANSNMASRRN